MIVLYLDMDGVFADFQAGIHKLFGKTDIPSGLKWATIRKVPSFWIDLPTCENADKLWELVSPYNPAFLTAIPWRKNGENIIKQKEDWAYFRYGDIKVHTCLRKEKVNYIIDEDTVLIDDRELNIEEWEEAGGTGFLYKPENFDSFQKEFLLYMKNK